MAKPGMSLRVEGLANLQRELRAVDIALPRELRAFNKDAATIVAEESARLAPVGPTGRLKKAHTVKAGAREASLKIGSNVRVPYAGPVIGGRHGYNKPNPFPFRALSNKSKELRDVYDNGIHKLIRRLT